MTRKIVNFKHKPTHRTAKLVSINITGPPEVVNKLYGSVVEGMQKFTEYEEE